jgi:hypothetical protein
MQAPESHLTMESSGSTDTTFTISTEGSDDGSGIRLFEIYVSTNNEPYELYSYTGDQSFEFTGDYSNSYRFYSLAVDSVANREAIPAQPDIEVSIVTGIKEIQEWEEVSIYPNPAGNSIFIEFTLYESNLVSCSLFDLNGRAVQTLFDKNLHSGFHQYEMLLEIPDGFYFMKVSSGNRRSFKKVVVAR